MIAADRCPMCRKAHAYREQAGLRVWLCPDVPRTEVYVAEGLYEVHGIPKDDPRDPR